MCPKEFKKAKEGLRPKIEEFLSLLNNKKIPKK